MFEVKQLCGQICIGKQGENLARMVYFDEPSIWKETFGEGKCELLHQRNGDEAPYPVVLNIENDRLCWKITSSDTAVIGEGKCELHYSVDGVIVKSKVWTTMVLPSLGGEVAEAPEPYQGWVDKVLGAAEKIEDDLVDLIEDTKELNEKTKFVLDAEDERQSNEEKRIEAEGQREVLKNEMETLKDETEDAIHTVEGLSTTMEQELTKFRQDASGALDGFGGQANASLEKFADDSNKALSDFDDKANEKLETFSTTSLNALSEFNNQADSELEKVKVATDDANAAADRANNTIDSMNKTFANAVKGSASGVCVRGDVSPIEHRLNVKLTSDTITDFSDVVVTRYGKNLFNKVKDGIAERTYISGTTTATRYGYEIILPVGSYTLTVFPLENPPSSTGNQLAYRVVDSDNKEVAGSHFISGGKNNTPVTFEIKQGYKLLIVKLSSNQNVNLAWESFQKYNIQLESGESETEYEEYVATTYTANADGTVDGVTSVYPTTTLLTDNSDITINMEYNKDINKVIAELQQAIISLGGNI